MTRRVSFSDFRRKARCHSSVNSKKLGISHSEREEFTVEDGCLLRGTRVVIPSKYQQEVLSELHLNHPGMVRMTSLEDCTSGGQIRVATSNRLSEIVYIVRLTAARHP